MRTRTVHEHLGGLRRLAQYPLAWAGVRTGSSTAVPAGTGRPRCREPAPDGCRRTAHRGDNGRRGVGGGVVGGAALSSAGVTIEIMPVSVWP